MIDFIISYSKKNQNITIQFNNILNDNGIINSKSYVGRYATSMEMAGMSISILKLDDELEKLLLEKANCPFWY